MATYKGHARLDLSTDFDRRHQHWSQDSICSTFKHCSESLLDVLANEPACTWVIADFFHRPDWVIIFLRLSGRTQPQIDWTGERWLHSRFSKSLRISAAGAYKPFEGLQCHECLRSRVETERHERCSDAMRMQEKLCDRAFCHTKTGLWLSAPLVGFGSNIYFGVCWLVLVGQGSPTYTSG